MKQFLFAAIFVLAFCAVLFAQNNQVTSCPQVTVDGPDAIPRPGDTITFTANVEGIDETNLIYNWTIDAGEIISGQGTSAITVKLSKDSTYPTATVDVKGFPEGCPNGDSETAPCFLKLPEPVKKAEFGQATNGYVKMLFDAFMVELNNDPSAQGYILNYGSDKEIAKRERQIRNAVVFLKLDASRITIVRGGDSGEGLKTQFWVVPAGATPPKP